MVLFIKLMLKILVSKNNFWRTKILFFAYTIRLITNNLSAADAMRCSKFGNWIKSLKIVFAQPAHWFTINAIAFHPNGQFFATASRDKTIKIWDANTFELLKVLEVIRDKGHVNSVNALLWHPYQELLLSAGDDRSIIIWETKKG